MRELEGRYPLFEFLHGYGLAVVAAGGTVPPALRALFGASSNVSRAAQIRQVYRRLGAGISQRLELQHEQEVGARLRSDLSRGQEDAVTRETALAAARDQLARLTAETEIQKARLAALTTETEAFRERNAKLTELTAEIKLPSSGMQ